MNNKTKIRLHLSKTLFESITREVLTETKKANDGYSVAVKQPKMPKQSQDQAKAPEVQKTDAEAMMGEMEMKVAEKTTLNEIDPSVSWESIAAGMAAIGLAPLAINKLHQWWEKKHPESFKKAQGISGQMDRTVGGNKPGQGHGAESGKFESTLKEYEQHYKMVNGQCRRYNDEGEYTVVNMSKCR